MGLRAAEPHTREWAVWWDSVSLCFQRDPDGQRAGLPRVQDPDALGNHCSASVSTSNIRVLPLQTGVGAEQEGAWEVFSDPINVSQFLCVVLFL